MHIGWKALEHLYETQSLETEFSLCPAREGLARLTDAEAQEEGNFSPRGRPGAP